MARIVKIPDELYEDLLSKAGGKGSNVQALVTEILRNNLQQAGETCDEIDDAISALLDDRALTTEAEARRVDEELRKAVENEPPYFPTIEEAMSWSRGRSWVADDPN